MLISKCFYRCFICHKIVGEGKEKQRHRMICHACKSFYDSHDFAKRLGFQSFNTVADSNYGFGEWFKDRWYGRELI